MSIQKINWLKYFLEVFAVFIGVSLAFGLNLWNEKRRVLNTESKTLLEIRNGLRQDIADMNINKYGHEKGIESCHYMLNLINGEVLEYDSVHIYFNRMFRDLISIQNSSGYESLKSKGLDIISNDSLRLQIIAIYDVHYEMIEKIEEKYSENQFHQSYYKDYINILSPYLELNQDGSIQKIKDLSSLSQINKNKLLSYTQSILMNRNFTLSIYEGASKEVETLIENINKEIGN